MTSDISLCLSTVTIRPTANEYNLNNVVSWRVRSLLKVSFRVRTHAYIKRVLHQMNCAPSPTFLYYPSPPSFFRYSNICCYSAKFVWHPILDRYRFHYQGNLILEQSFPLAVPTVTYYRKHGGRDHDHLFKIDPFPASVAPYPVWAYPAKFCWCVSWNSCLGHCPNCLFLLALHMPVLLVLTVLKSFRIHSKRSPAFDVTVYLGVCGPIDDVSLNLPKTRTTCLSIGAIRLRPLTRSLPGVSAILNVPRELGRFSHIIPRPEHLSHVVLIVVDPKWSSSFRFPVITLHLHSLQTHQGALFLLFLPLIRVDPPPKCIQRFIQKARRGQASPVV